MEICTAKGLLFLSFFVLRVFPLFLMVCFMVLF